MPLVIHFGIRESEVDVFRNQLIRMIPEGVDPVKHIEDWESSYTETLLDNPVHLIVETMTPMVILNFLVNNFPNFLIPLSGGNRDGVRIFVTDDNRSDDGLYFDDEIKEYIELRYPE